MVRSPEASGVAPRRVSALWIGQTLSPYEELCLASFVAGGFDVDLWVYGDVARVPAGVRLRPAAELVAESEVFTYLGQPLAYGGTSNVFRYRMLQREATAWIDADVLLVGDALPSDPELFGLESPGVINGAVLRLPPGSPALDYLASHVGRFDRATVKHGMTGPRILSEALREFDLVGRAQPVDVLYPLHWSEAWKLFDPRATEEVERRVGGSATVHLWNEMLRLGGTVKDHRPPAGSFLAGAFARAGVVHDGPELDAGWVRGPWRAITEAAAGRPPRGVRARARATDARASLELAGRRARQVALLHRRAVRLDGLEGRQAYKLAHDRRPELHAFVDRVSLRERAIERVGTQHVAPLLQVVERTSDVDWDALPEEFVLRPAHLPWGAVIVHRGAPADACLPASFVGPHPLGRFAVTPAHAHRVRLSALGEDWLRLRNAPAQRKGFPLWAYRGVRPRLLLEGLVRDERGVLPDDVECYVVGGAVRLVRHLRADVRDGAVEDVEEAWFAADGTRVDARLVTERPPHPRPMAEGASPPAALGELVRVAEALGAEEDLVRVDLAAAGAHVIVRGMTPYPQDGRLRLAPEAVERWLAAWWVQPYGPSRRARRPGPGGDLPPWPAS